MTQVIQRNLYPNHAIEPSREGDGWNVYEWGTYPKGSVLEGQDKKSFVEFSSDQYAMKLKYPGAEVFDHVVECTSAVGSAPANYYAGDGGFYEAGEYWSEEDY